ncbi:MAG: aldehyde dehydrogenase family protein, partial [Actinomycetota bacterium]|nr:aldehyde dehydrogenase family protein [Actinomycetota bacterium]
AVIDHPAVSAVSLTGSSPTGARAARACARWLKPLQAELGGNNAAVVLAGADLDRAAGDLAASAYSFAGQRCTAARRLIVEKGIEADFLDRFETAVKVMELGDPHDPSTVVGPVISRRQQRRLLGLLDGERALLGGGVPAELAAGCFLRPALVRPGSPDHQIVREETFGPVAVLLTAKNREEAFALANAVPQGLIAALYSDDPDDQRRFLAVAQAGSLKLNRPTTEVSPSAPFGGWKQSGLGPPEHGRWALDFYTRPQAVYEKTARTSGSKCSKGRVS